MQTLRVHESGRRLVTADGERFYLLGDTAWELFHRLNREEAAEYLRTRKEQGFNMIQAVVLAELEGLTVPNAYGRLPLLDCDPLRPDDSGDYSYFDHVEYILSLAEELGLYVGLLPTWGDKFNQMWGKGPEVFTSENAFGYGRWLAGRFCHHNNLIWVLGGDRPPETDTHYAVLDQMAAGLKAGDGGKFLCTFHPWGKTSSSEFVHDKEWLDFNMMQSGHSRPAPPCYELMAADYARTPIKPVMDGEPCYEDHPIDFNPGNGFYDEVDVRLAAYRNLLGGACGNTYGHHAVWQMMPAPSGYCPNTWQAALHAPGAEELHIYRDFVAANDLADHRPVYDAVEDNAHDGTYVAAMVSERSAYLYLPTGSPVRVNMVALSFTPTRCRLFEPTTGTYADAPLPDAEGHLALPTRRAGRGRDVVVIFTP